MVAANSRIGPRIPANFALLKNTVMRNPKVISLKPNMAKKAHNMLTSVWGRTVKWSNTTNKVRVTRNWLKKVRNQDIENTQSFRPIIC
jgi:hypothetical protein